MSGSLSSSGTNIMYQGDTFPPYNPQLLDESGNPISLSGITASNLTLVLVPHSAATSPMNGGGSFTINDSANGIITYAWVAADTATLGSYDRFVLVAWPGGNPEHIGPDQFDVKPVS